MKAYQLKKSGKPGILKIEEIEEPDPSGKEVKIKIETIGINYAETLSRRGQYSWSPKRPYILGMEGYGEVVAVGKDVSLHKIGDKVIVGRQYGVYAEYVCAEEHLCFSALSGFTSEENAAFLVNFMTAWVALKKMCRVVPGERVLVQAAAGGVGTAAVQIAKKLGCYVYGTASNDQKLKLIEELGADVAINYAIQDFYDEVKKEGSGVDCVLEVVGGEVFRKSLKLLNPFGRMAVIGYASINIQWWNPVSIWRTLKNAPKVKMISMAKRSQGIFASHIGYLTTKKVVTSQIWDELKAFVHEHDLKPVIGKVFSFKDLPKAHAFMESRQSTGKIVVKI